ncbi:MAG: glycosyltransferase family 2 protein [Thermodesulfobacteriota bacterium]
MTRGLSVIVPVLNEADIIETNTRRLVNYLDGLDFTWEVIVISNGSTDRTEEIGRRLAEEISRVRFLSVPTKGVGLAFSLGVRMAGFDRIVSVDMDLSIDLAFIHLSFDLLRDYHIVVGSKKMGAQDRNFIRKAGSSAFILAARLLLGLSFEDYSIAAKAYRRAVASSYLDRIDGGTSYVLDIIYHALADGGRAVEIPVYCQDYRASKFNLMHEAVYRYHRLFRLWWRYRLRRPKPTI